MSDTTRTSTAAPGTASAAPPGTFVHPANRAARELALGRGAFEAGVSLGHIRTVPAPDGGGRGVTRAEIERLRAEPDFPTGLRHRTETTGTRDGAALMGIAPGRFTRLARLGLLSPVAFRVNRYRTVVWFYPTEELRGFAADVGHTVLLAGRTPGVLRDQLATGIDLRPRNWRARQLSSLLDAAESPFERAAAVASLLDPVQTARAVPDAGECARLARHRPAHPGHGSPGSPAAQVAEVLMTAREPDEVGLLLAELRQAMAEAHLHDPAPESHREPVADHHRGPAPALPPMLRPPTLRPAAGRTGPRRLLARLRRPHRGRPVTVGVPGRAAGTTAPAALLHSARNSPSWTTETSSRPSTS
jgi:hypothetical protein